MQFPSYVGSKAKFQNVSLIEGTTINLMIFFVKSLCHLFYRPDILQPMTKIHKANLS